ncbi:FAD-dependent monooxygenase [Legionella tunisiensis]|uniref:FAD-dependent monooxygenase n=1 Tax=Legionella tunisiensis TaxID=1034944 RepID=UPI0012EAEBA0|nr:FAD-dependent monooxygenase [Legionella tunisiensis]
MPNAPLIFIITMKILISGAGTAGLSVAYWLKRYGYTPTLVESAPELRTGGYKIDVRGKALQILQHAGIFDAVVAASTDMQEALLVNKHGHIIHKMSGDTFGHRMGDDQEIMRGTLNQILQDQILGVEILFGDSIQTITQTADNIHVKFEKHPPCTYDLLIGADGLHSNVRRLIFGNESSFSHELGIYLCVFSVPNYLNLDRIEMEYTELGRVAGIWSSRGDKNAKAYFAFTSSIHIEPRDTAAQKQLLQKVFADVGGEIPKLLTMMATTDDFYFDAVSQIHMNDWSSQRVVLLGDAAYCASPMSGQGTSLALVGAYVLAGELALAKGDYHKAFNQFDKKCVPT